MKIFLSELVLRLRARLRPRPSRRAVARHRRILVESLEDRSLLAQLVNVGTATEVIYNLPASASVVFLEDDGIAGNGVSQIRSANGTFDTTTFANPSGSLTINRGNAADTMTVNALPDFTAGLAIGLAGLPLSGINFAGAMTLATDKSLTGFASGTIKLSNAASDLTALGTGAILLTTTRDISLVSGASITTIDGSLTLSANQQSTPTSGNFVGVDVNGATIRTSGTGALAVRGRGGDNGFSQRGVQVLFGGVIRSSMGSLNVVGKGGASAGDDNSGVWIGYSGSTITSSGGDVQLTGLGGGLGASVESYGVLISSSAQVSAGGTGTVTVHGTGGSGSGSSNFGVRVLHDGSAIFSNDGNIKVMGQGGDSGTNIGIGVMLDSLAFVSAGGSGTVSVQGTGGSGSSGYGVWVAGATITSSVGNVQVTGQGGGLGASGSGVGVLVDEGQVTAGGLGSVTVNGTGGSGSGGDNYGVWVRSGLASAITSSGGNVHVTGQGGGSGESGNDFGVVVSNSGQVSAGGHGTVTVLGTGGPASGGFNNGVNVWFDGLITSSGGNVQVTGQGGGLPVSGTNIGVNIYSGRVSAGGNGSVKVQGTGGVGSSGSNDGVNVSFSGQVSAAGSGTVTVEGTGGAGAANYGNNGVWLTGTDSTITSGGGNVQVTGKGSGGLDGFLSRHGVLVDGSNQISAGGNGTVNIQGDGGAGSSNFSYGVALFSEGLSVTSGGGDVQIAGIEGTGTSSTAISASAISTAANGGTLTLIGDSMSFASSISTNAASSVTLRPFTNGLGIRLGTEASPNDGSLAISDSKLDRITTGTINIGDANSGAINIRSVISRATATNILLSSGGAIDFAGGIISTAGGTLGLSPGNSASVSVATVGTDILVGTTSGLMFADGSDLTFTINGKTVNTQYHQLNVAGSVELTSVDLVLTGSYTPEVGNSFVLVNNDGTDDVIGEFNDLPDNEVFTIASGDLAGNYRITYHGGDGNDVVLTAVNVAPTFDHVLGDYSAADENVVTHGPAGEQRIVGWATNVSAGPENESSQQLSFEVIADMPVLFTTNGQPAVSVDGTLTYTPRPNTYGVVNITVVLHDDGDGTNTSGEVTFQIEITKPRKLHNSAEGGARNGLDVTGSTSAQPDGIIASGDALAVINYINAKGSGHIPAEAGYGPPYCDVTGDDEVAADDVLKVINYINSGNAQEGEAGGGFSAVAIENSTASQALMLEQVALPDLDGKSPSELLSLLAADLATAQVKRRRVSS